MGQIWPRQTCEQQVPERVTAMSRRQEIADDLMGKLIYCDFRTEVGIDQAKQHIRLALMDYEIDVLNSASEMISKQRRDGE